MYIKIEDVSKKYKEKIILEHISLALEKGRIHVFFGHNASGKTMFFRALCGFIKINSGCIEIDAKPVIFNKDLPVNVGLILENPGFIPDMSGIENLNYLALIKNKKIDDELKQRILNLLKRFNLFEAKEEKVKTYSLGMRQKLAIIQATMENQELIILDEPTNALDKASVEIFNAYILELRNAGKTILIASHNEHELNKIVDKFYSVNSGRIDVSEGYKL